MSRRLPWAVALCVSAGLAWAAGCSGKPPSSGDAGVDAGSADSGRDAGADAGVVDAGPPGECHLDLQSCADGGSCLLVTGDAGWPDVTACLGGACDLVKQDCDAGLMCGYAVNDAG